MKHIILTLSVLVTFLLSTTTSATNKPKNIILILADDLGWADTTLYGKTSLYETPNIQHLASRGMTFLNAYASPICSPTRASILTGQNPARLGLTTPAAHLKEERFEAVPNPRALPHQKSTNVQSATRMDISLPTLGVLIKQAGYSTAHFGKWHLGREGHTPLERGFDVDIPHWHGPGPKTGYLAPWGYDNFKEGEPGQHIEDRMAREAVQWLKDRDHSKPFFMNYWQFSVHAPFGAKPELIDSYRKKINPDSIHRSPTYAAMVHSLDDAVGTLMQALEDEGITDETIVIFYSDNGGNTHCGLQETDTKGDTYITAVTSNYPLRGGKGGIHEGGIRVPAVFVWPGVTTAGSRNETRIQSLDLYPTILKMLGIVQPEEHIIDGRDFTKALEGVEYEREPMFTYVPSYGNTPQWLPPSMAVHYKQWKLIRTFYHGENGTHQHHLYDLEKDIGENKNLASSQPAVVKKLDGMIDQYIKDAKVVLPLMNPNFDATKFAPSLIGVQAGGLKMPPGYKTENKAKTAPTAPKKMSPKGLLGWISRGADVEMNAESLKLTPNNRQPFMTTANLQVEGPIDFRIRLRTARDGVGKLQWRTHEQELFPESGQLQSFEVTAGEWQQVKLHLNVAGKLKHVRLFLPSLKDITEIDWIEIASQAGNKGWKKRGDFKSSTKPPEGKTNKPDDFTPSKK
ncbi:MAG: N-acetylgalactosamine 6-sulfate sulfatase [Planctomycetaceae bacterium]|nr:N-acetylgalactosamine 6-sulfate sulfatase [Planctomycetaceae bacterium]